MSSMSTSHRAGRASLQRGVRCWRLPGASEPPLQTRWGRACQGAAARLRQDPGRRLPGLQLGCGRPESPHRWPGDCACAPPCSGTAGARLHSSMHKRLGRTVHCRLIHGVVSETMEQCLHPYKYHSMLWHVLCCMQTRYRKEGVNLLSGSPGAGVSSGRRQRKLTDAIFSNNGALLLAARGLVGELRLLAILQGRMDDPCDPCSLRHIAGGETDGSQQGVQQC